MTTSHQPGAVLFDAYGTLFDVYSVGLLAEQWFPGQGQALAKLWRDKQIEYTRLVSSSNHGTHYQPFSQLTQAALRYAINAINLGAIQPNSVREDGQFDAPSKALAAFEQLMHQYRHLTAFTECAAVLQALRSRGVVTGILSNGDPEMLQAAVTSAGLDKLLDHTISVDAIGKYKTHPEAYALGPQTLGLPASRIVFVSSNGWDALAATWYGYQTLWVNRAGMPREEIGPPPTRTSTKLHDVLSFF